MVSKKTSGWLGGGKKEEQPAPEFKVSAWAAKADEYTGGGMKFAPLKQEQGPSGRKEQEFVYTSKKEITSWMVNAEDVSKLTQKDFVFKEVETDFVSLTDDTINKELAEVLGFELESKGEAEVQGYGAHRNRRRSEVCPAGRIREPQRP